MRIDISAFDNHDVRVPLAVVGEGIDLTTKEHGGPVLGPVLSHEDCVNAFGEDGIAELCTKAVQTAIVNAARTKRLAAIRKKAELVVKAVSAENEALKKRLAELEAQT